MEKGRGGVRLTQLPVTDAAGTVVAVTPSRESPVNIAVISREIQQKIGEIGMGSQKNKGMRSRSKTVGLEERHTTESSILMDPFDAPKVRVRI